MSANGGVLTPAQYKVLSLVRLGMGNQEVATALGISEATVESHMGDIFTKLGAKNRTHAVYIATRRGLLGKD